MLTVAFVQHAWLHILNCTTGTCVLCLKYKPSVRPGTFQPDLTTLDDHAKSKSHLAAKAQYMLDRKWLAQLAREGACEANVEKNEAQLDAALAAQRDAQDAERRALIACRVIDPAAQRDTTAWAIAAGEALAAGKAELAVVRAARDVGYPETAIKYPCPAEQIDNCLASAATKSDIVQRVMGGNVDSLGVRLPVNEIQTIINGVDKQPPSHRGKFAAAARACFTCLGILKRGRPMLEYEGAMQTAIALGDISPDSLYCNDDFGWRFAEIINLVLVQV